MLEAIRDRRSVRKYRPTDVSDEEVRELLEAARLAPSGGNSQPWGFLVVRDPERRKAVMEACHHQEWMMGAPVFVACVGDVGRRVEDSSSLEVDETNAELHVKTTIRDTAIAAEHIVLQAQAMGLSTCWVAWFEQNAIRPVLGVPLDKYVVAVLTVGHADESPDPRPRRPLSEMVHHENWNA